MQINLLPWREIKRQQQKQRSIRLFAVAIIVPIVIILVMNHYALKALYAQRYRNQRLQQEAVRAEQTITDNTLLQRRINRLATHLYSIQSLRNSRFLTVHLFDELVKIVPDDVYFTKITRQGAVIEILGHSRSNIGISRLLRNIQQNHWMQQVLLADIKRISPYESEFKVSLTLQPKAVSNEKLL